MDGLSVVRRVHADGDSGGQCLPLPIFSVVLVHRGPWPVRRPVGVVTRGASTHPKLQAALHGWNEVRQAQYFSTS
jgi:hypothetical protein